MCSYSINSASLLKSLRQKEKLTQKKLAELAGVSQSTIVKYEIGTRKISKNMDKTLSRILNVDTLLKNQIIELSDLMNQLIAFKERSNLTNKILAEQIGIDAALLSSIYNGKRLPSKKVKQKMIDFLFMEGEDILLDVQQTENSVKLPKVNKLEMGLRIKKIRKNRNETLEQMGKQVTCSVGKNVVSRWEKGINVPNIESLMNIAFLGNVTVPYILYGETFSKMLKQGNSIENFSKLNSFLLGLRLRKIRKDYRLEREDFGKLFSPPITKWSMDKYENGKDIPNTERIVQYAYIGKTSLEFLIYGVK